MNIHTTRFGDLDVPDGDIITLPEGVLGFPDSTQYVLLEHDSEGTPFKWLQSCDDPDIAFIVMDPHLVVEGYEVHFDEETAEMIGCTNVDEEFAMMSIVNVPHDRPIEMTVNVRAPIIVHLEKRIGWQVILANEEYPIRHQLFIGPDAEKPPQSDSGSQPEEEPKADEKAE